MYDRMKRMLASVSESVDKTIKDKIDEYKEEGITNDQTDYPGILAAVTYGFLTEKQAEHLCELYESGQLTPNDDGLIARLDQAGLNYLDGKKNPDLAEQLKGELRQAVDNTKKISLAPSYEAKSQANAPGEESPPDYDDANPPPSYKPK